MIKKGEMRGKRKQVVQKESEETEFEKMELCGKTNAWTGLLTCGFKIGPDRLISHV